MGEAGSKEVSSGSKSGGGGLTVDVGSSSSHRTPSKSSSSGKYSSPRKGKHSKKSFGHDSIFDDKIKKALKASLEKKKSAKGKNPWVRILLSFPRIRVAYRQLRIAFQKFDTSCDGVIQYDELVSALNFLLSQGGENTAEKKEEINAMAKDVFASSDVYKDGVLSFKEFLVGLHLCYVLGFMTDSTLRSVTTEEEKKEEGTTNNDDGKTSEEEGKVDSKEEKTEAMTQDVVAMRRAFEAVIEAFLIFDVDGSGFFTKADLEKQLNELQMIASPTKKMMKHTKEKRKVVNAISPHMAAPVLTFLSADRMDELDVNKDGVISLAEFIWAFENWVDDEEEF
eukprot:g3724.t1